MFELHHVTARAGVAVLSGYESLKTLANTVHSEPIIRQIMIPSRCLHHAYTKRLLPTSSSSAALSCRSSSSKALVLHTRQFDGQIPTTVEDRLGIAQGGSFMSRTSFGDKISCRAASTRLAAGPALGHCNVQSSTVLPISRSTGRHQPGRCFSSAPSAGAWFASSDVRILFSREL
jgi:hypothetical protein